MTSLTQTLKQRVQSAIAVLGKSNADATIASKQRELEKNWLTLRQQAECLEAAIGDQSKLSAPSATLPQSPSPTKLATATGYELVDQYRGVASQEEREVFWHKHRTALHGSGIPEIVLCRIAAGKKIEGYSLLVLGLARQGSETKPVQHRGKFSHLNGRARLTAAIAENLKS